MIHTRFFKGKVSVVDWKGKINVRSNPFATAVVKQAASMEGNKSRYFILALFNISTAKRPELNGAWKTEATIAEAPQMTNVLLSSSSILNFFINFCLPINEAIPLLTLTRGATIPPLRLVPKVTRAAMNLKKVTLIGRYPNLSLTLFR